MIRKSCKEDIDRIAEIWLYTNIAAHDFIPSQYWENHFELVKEMFLDAELYVYEDTGTIQGFVGLSDHYIAGIFVAAEAQSRGIGSQLLNYVKTLKKTLTLSVYQKNTRAVNFYQREGFEIQSEGVDENTGEKEYSMILRQLEI